MKTFKVLSPGGHCTNQEVELIIRSFAELYFSVTHKHRRRMKLLLAVETNQFLMVIKNIGKKNLPEAIELIELNEFNTAAKDNSTILFLPSSRKASKYLMTALKNGLPVLSFDGLVQRQFIDNSCGLLVSQQSKEHNISDFSSFLNMLYFDPEANKMLQKGALKRFQYLKSQSTHTKQALPNVALPQVA